MRINFDSTPRPSKLKSQLEASNIADLMSALAAIPNDDTTYEEWYRIGLAFHRGCGKRAETNEACDAWLMWCAKFPDDKPRESLKKWKSFFKPDDRPANRKLGAGTIMAMVKDAGWKRDAKQSQPGTLKVSRMSDITAKALEPLWPGFLYRGKITISAGLPGDGKSLSSNDITARITSGGRWPVGNGRFEVAPVLMLTAEDDPNDTIRPRLDMAGANTDLIDLIEGVHHEDLKTKENTLDLVSLINDLPKIEALIIERGAHLLIIDPLTSFADSDTNKTGDMRRLLDGVAQMAIRTRVAVLIITHLNKRSDARKAMQMIAGSHVIVAAVRVVFVMGRDPNDQDRFLVLSIKMNIGPGNAGYAFRVLVKRHPISGDVPTVQWESDGQRHLGR